MLKEVGLVGACAMVSYVGSSLELVFRAEVLSRSYSDRNKQGKLSYRPTQFLQLVPFVLRLVRRKKFQSYEIKFYRPTSHSANSL